MKQKQFIFLLFLLLLYSYSCKKKATTLPVSIPSTLIEAISLVGPTNNAVNQNIQPIFVWSSSQPSVKYYKIYYGTSPSELIPDETNYTDSTALSDTVRLDNGIGTAYLAYQTNYYWKVEGRDINHNLIYTSPVNVFTVRSALTIPIGRANLSTTTFDNALYAIAGNSTIYNVLSTVESFNGSTWRSNYPLKVPRRGLSTAVYDNKLYAIGGYNITTYLDTVEYYDNGTTWNGSVSMTVPRAYLGVAVYNNDLYTVGGFNNTGDLDTVEIFRNNIWNIGTSLNVPRRGLGVAVYGANLYAMGGFNETNQYLDTVEYFNGSTWRAAPSMITPRAFFGTAVANYLFAMGGITISDGSIAPTNAVEYFDGTSWHRATNMPVERQEASATLYNNRIYMVGGLDGNGNNVTVVDIYNYLTNQWE
ncbi:MAG: hypothetical protein QM528_06500 [Phycisphaerales bacterium]|nr:hypothetical protein [Phycisphaerales bacterium]